MQSSQNPNFIVELKRLVESNNRSEIRLNANGGNSILVICPPLEEHKYITSFRSKLNGDFKIIDLNQLLVSFLDKNRADIEELFELLKGSVSQVFKSAEEEDVDFFSFIMQEIKQTMEEGKIPVLVRTGSLYGSGIENIHLMEHPIVMRAAVPLIILYPAVREAEKILFLSIRPASKYRCMMLK